jgi:puromycin-sensitive aminopeptidase
MNQNKHRLPNHIKPHKYKITIAPNMGDFTFIGHEIIDIEISKATKQLILHSLDTKVLDAVWISGKQKQEAKKISYDVKSETVVFDFTKAITGKGKLELNFSGIINDQLHGFYRSRYIHNKQEKHLAVTQFEATDARRAFPCFDEPSHKAVFDVSVIVPKHLQVISNTVEKSVLAHEKGLKIINFASTPRMSSYLLALIVGEFEHIKGKTKNGVQIRVHTTPGKKQQGKFALDVAIRSLEFLENYFAIKFPLPVLDLIALPDFSSAAMENWGAITFRETALLVDEKLTPFLNKQRVAEVIAHELVHQWFGNLVTMEWWTHLWLNESFATYMAYVTIDKLYPEWNYWTKFVLQEQSIALHKDSLQSVQPVEVEVKHPNEISESFDPAIVYAKGASVLRMLASFIGEDNFRKGLALYLKKHSYKNTSSVHLWEAFEQVSGLPVKKFMHTWTTVPGFPSVEVKTQSNQLLAKQSVFGFKPTKKNTTWIVPLLPNFGDNQDANNNKYVLDKSQKSFSIPEQSKFVKLNNTEPAYYIADYSAGDLAKLLPEIESKTISSVDRLAIIRNCLLLAKSGKISTEVYLEVLKFYENDDSYIVWSEIASGFSQLFTAFHGTSNSDALTKYRLKLFSQLLMRENLGFIEKKNESLNIKSLRGLAYLQAGMSGHKASLSFAKKYFADRLKNKSLDAEMRMPTYCIMAKYGSGKDIDNLINIYHKSTMALEQQQVLVALTKASPKNVGKAIRFLLSDEIRDQDRHLALDHALSNPQNKSVVWHDVKKHWDMLNQKYASGRALGVIVSGLESFNTEAELKDLKLFFSKVDTKTFRQVLKHTIERVEVNISWQTRDTKELHKYLKSEGL